MFFPLIFKSKVNSLRTQPAPGRTLRLILKSQLTALCDGMSTEIKISGELRRNIKVLQRKIFPPVVSVVLIVHSISVRNVVHYNVVVILSRVLLPSPGPLPTPGPGWDLCMTGLSLLLLAGLASIHWRPGQRLAPRLQAGLQTQHSHHGHQTDISPPLDQYRGQFIIYRYGAILPSRRRILI